MRDIPDWQFLFNIVVLPDRARATTRDERVHSKEQ
jgi:hypothetical protein